MKNSQSHKASHRNHRQIRRSRDGVVLLIVLGMLALFTVLAVTYTIFSSQMADSSFASQRHRLDQLPPDPPLESAMLQLIVGTDDTRSAAFRNSLLEDFYGVDGYEMTVAHRRGPVSDGRTPPAVPGGQLMLPVDTTNGTPRTTLFKFPTHLAWWNFDGNPAQVLPAPAPIPPAERARQRTELSPTLDDAFAGRIITFEEGPLQKIPFRVIRSFGTDNGTPDQGANINNPAEYSLAGNVVIDLSDVGIETISIDGVTEPLYTVADSAPNRLLYAAGPDGAPGIVNVDDDGNGQIDDVSELGTIGSDDYGYRFVLNGLVFNGRGINPSGVSGIRRNTNPLDQNAEMEFTVNARLTGEMVRGGNNSTEADPEPDEGWDAPDLENWFLGWQPSDHRRAAGQSIYGGANAALLNRQLGQHIIPSFHRPSLINYLMNAPIWLPGETRDPNNPARTFAQIEANPQAGDYDRLVALVSRLRRATPRPLNFPHEFPTVSGNTPDFNQDGDPFDGAPFFSGSNPTDILNRPIDLQNSEILEEIKELATWLINGPWDIDNDGDGIPDSVWVDMNLPTVSAPDGQLIKPMVAALIEDWDGRININHQGSYNQLTNQRFPNIPTSIAQSGYQNDSEYFAANQGLASFSRGGGLGPAELDFSHLFFNDFAQNGFLGPVPTNQIGPAISIDQILRTRYGNLLNVRYGGQVYGYAPPYPYQIPAPPATINRLANFLHFPGAGTRFNPRTNADLLAQIPFPSRVNNHQSNSVAGRPIDMSGVMQTTKGFGSGGHFFNRLPAGDEIANQPYEFGATEIRGDDQPFSVAEFIDFQKGGALNTRLSQLLNDAANRNNALRNLISPESRAVDSPEIPGERGFIQFIAGKINGLTTPDALNTQLNRMLAVEFRKGSKLNLNRQIGNEQDDDNNGLGDETNEVRTIISGPTNSPNNRVSNETAFPQIAGDYPQQATVNARYGNNSMFPGGPIDFDGYDTDGDGQLDVGTPIADVDGDGNLDILKSADGAELLARHLYCLMFALIEDSGSGGGELVPNFPYPSGLASASTAVKDNYVARRIAQWAVNAVDYRDVDAKCTRLRYDPNPFAGGFQLDIAAVNTVWGMERPEVEISEAFAVHDKRLKRNLQTSLGNTDADGELTDDEDNDPLTAPDPDGDMDQFRIPQATAMVELHSLRPPVAVRTDANSNIFYGETHESLPGELYSNNQLDLGRVVRGNATDPNDPLLSPVWRLAVGAPTGGDPNRSTRWIFDGTRVGDELVGNQGETEELNYLQPSNDWSDSAYVQNQYTTNWVNGLGQSAEIRDASDATGAFVTIASPEFNATSAANHQIRLERFAWFAKVQRATAITWSDNVRTTTGTAPRVLQSPASGMTFTNTFFNFNDRITPNDATMAMNSPTLLMPGGYAIVGPRANTIFGQSSQSNVATNFEYHPVNQRLQFVVQGQGPNLFRLNYFDLLESNGTIPLTPRYYEDGVGNNYYHQAAVVPLLCESLMPHEVDPTRTDWQGYLQTCLNDPAANGNPVDLGFNVSAPLTGAAYYPAPTDRISPNGTGSGYPFRDGYRGYDPMNPTTNLHPDVPFDHRAGTPMEDNGYNIDTGGGATVPVQWNSIGTHQEIRTVFLQRLADPTSPWHPIDNPYLTVDFSPIDLTTINGEEDPATPVDRDGDGDPTNDSYFADSGRSVYANGTGFTPPVKLDSRRKIPNPVKDRTGSRLVEINTPANDLSDYERQVFTYRSPLSASFSILRRSGRVAAPLPAGGTAYWQYELGSMWPNQNRAESDDVTAGINTRDIHNPTVDLRATRFKQTLGFVNREYGFPTDWQVNITPYLQGVSVPDGVINSIVPWMDREYQSNYDLANVPAVSRTGLLPSFDTGTDHSVVNFERQISFGHLLGFEQNYSQYRAADSAGSNPVGIIGNANGDYENSVADFTGDRAGFEQIFDYVDVGPVWFDSQRWFDPVKIQFQAGNPAMMTMQQLMFNRTVETLQPPYNYVGKHRTPGKINLNTTPDYIRKGPNFFDPDFDPNNIQPLIIGRQFLDATEDPANPDELPANINYVRYNPTNFPVNGNGFTNQFSGSPPLSIPPAELFGNGSVYRSFAQTISTLFELDTTQGTPRTMGEPDLYQQTVDTFFGRGFKAFIESRRGYSTTLRGPAMIDFSSGAFYGNPMLDARYPTQFAGVFAPARASATPSIQRMTRLLDRDSNLSRPRRTHDMGLMRPHPDFDERNLDNSERSIAYAGALDAGGQTTDTFALDVEEAPSGGGVTVPTLTPNGSTVNQLEISLLNRGLFERPQAELHSDFRNLDNDAYFRYRDIAKLSGMTTHHSNVFQIRMTLSYFVVDPTTGAVGREYIGQNGEPLRSRGSFVVDRTIPVGFLRGRDLGAERTVIYSEIE